MDPRKNSALISDLKMEKSRLQHARQNPNRHVSINQSRQTHVLTVPFQDLRPESGYFLKTDSKLNPVLLVVPRMTPNGAFSGQKGTDYN